MPHRARLTRAARAHKKIKFALHSLPAQLLVSSARPAPIHLKRSRLRTAPIKSCSSSTTSYSQEILRRVGTSHLRHRRVYVRGWSGFREHETTNRSLVSSLLMETERTQNFSPRQTTLFLHDFHQKPLAVLPLSLHMQRRTQNYFKRWDG